MENLSLEDPPPGGAPLPPQAIPQLPPQMFTTAAQLLDLTDKKLMVILRDGRKLVGVLRSWDQYANLVLQDTVEKVYSERAKKVATIERGLFIVRGENVLLLGEIDLDKDDYVPEPYTDGVAEAVDALHRQELKDRLNKEKTARKKLEELGFEGELTGEAIF